MSRFPNNSRVCFVGDSITHCNKYLMRIVAFYKRHFPDSNVNFYNCGFAGANLSEQLKIIENDTFSYNPTHIVMMIGINDSRRGCLVNPRGTQKYEMFKCAFEKYKDNLSRICEIFKSRNLEVTLCTCVPYDEYGDYCTAPLKGGMPLIMSYNEYIRDYAKQNGIALCDYFPYMIEKMQTECLYDSDGVHPNDRGHYYMAKCFLEYQGLDFEEVHYTKEMEEWNDNVVKLRDIYAAEYLVLGDYSLSYDEAVKKADLFIEQGNKDNVYDEHTFNVLCRFAEQYKKNKPIQKDIKNQMIRLMEDEI